MSRESVRRAAPSASESPPWTAGRATSRATSPRGRKEPPWRSTCTRGNGRPDRASVSKSWRRIRDASPRERKRARSPWRPSKKKRCPSRVRSRGRQRSRARVPPSALRQRRVPSQISNREYRRKSRSPPPTATRRPRPRRGTGQRRAGRPRSTVSRRDRDVRCPRTASSYIPTSRSRHPMKPCMSRSRCRPRSQRRPSQIKEKCIETKRRKKLLKENKYDFSRSGRLMLNNCRVKQLRSGAGRFRRIRKNKSRQRKLSEKYTPSQTRRARSQIGRSESDGFMATISSEPPARIGRQEISINAITKSCSRLGSRNLDTNRSYQSRCQKNSSEVPASNSSKKHDALKKRGLKLSGGAPETEFANGPSAADGRNIFQAASRIEVPSHLTAPAQSLSKSGGVGGEKGRISSYCCLLSHHSTLGIRSRNPKAQIEREKLTNNTSANASSSLREEISQKRLLTDLKSVKAVPDSKSASQTNVSSGHFLLTLNMSSPRRRRVISFYN